MIVADHLGGRLIDNHLMLDAAGAIYDRGTSGWSVLREEVREVVFAHARRLPAEVAIVLTDALADEPAARALYQPAIDLAHVRGTRLFACVLDLDLEENRRRLIDPSRAGGAKLMDTDTLETIREHERLLVPDGAPLLDVTKMSPNEAAKVIIARLEVPGA
ncbi:hypothetical protein [uncultured Roseobacter sp.]|uniref:hypothetical protein n=1 Tax=uncultured Roseobacter sp. TaxID=114847 RepID=UPI002635A43B|nr:hypothetical protein [uncultured Roseobacter sp.]